jgi:hypothetical protein
MDSVNAKKLLGGGRGRRRNCYFCPWDVGNVAVFMRQHAHLKDQQHHSDPHEATNPEQN